LDTEDFFEALIELEDVMGEEELLGTKVHEVLKAVMLIQQTNEDPEEEKEKLCHEVKEIKEMDEILGLPKMMKSTRRLRKK
jgi:ketol-acid reductoisomerase